MYLVTATLRLAKHGDRAKGFHSFRRFRITRLREFGCPEDILRFWAGHSSKGITDKYSKLSENVDLRKQWSEKVGLGFDVPKLCAEHPAPSSPKTRKARKRHQPHQPESPQSVVRSEAPEIIEPQIPSYVAEDSDLPEIFFEASEA
jgi:hypothetical protein